MAKVSKERKEFCKNYLLKFLKPGDAVYCILRHVSRTGMSGVINLYALKDNDLHWIGGLAADMLELSYTNKYGGGIKVSGAGMDLGFWLVYRLSEKLFDDGYALRHDWL